MKKISDLEETLWYQIRVAGLPIPIREYRFCMTRKYRADFAWPAEMLIVECEGGTWSRGRHVTGAGFSADCEKYNLAALLGFRILRFTSKEIQNGEALRTIEKALARGIKQQGIERLGLRSCGMGQ